MESAPGSDDELARAALDRLGLAAGAKAAPQPGESLLDALVREGALARHQLLGVRAYVTRHAATCACGARRLLPERDDPGACPACGARPSSPSSSSSGGDASGSSSEAQDAPVTDDPLARPPSSRLEPRTVVDDGPLAPGPTSGPGTERDEAAVDPSGSTARRGAAAADPSGSTARRGAAPVDISGSTARRGGAAVDPTGSAARRAAAGDGLAVSASGKRRRQAMQALGPGDRVGPLELLETLGRGASGIVFRARHVELGRESAVKVLPGAASDERRRRRFERETEALGRLGHPGIVRVHATFEVDDALVLEMELVDGETLAGRIERDGPLPWREAATMCAELARAVEHAHQADVLHRDLKPENVLVRREGGRPLLADFGLGRLSDQASSLTVQGGILGTPVYMAPEAFEGESSPRTDVYGLGGILYTALTGLPPFEASSAAALHYAVSRGACAPTNAPGAPPALEAVRARAMAVAPAERYQRAADLAGDLELVLAGRASSVSSSTAAKAAAIHPLGLAAAALAVVVALALGLAHGLGDGGAPVDAPRSRTRVEEAFALLAGGEAPGAGDEQERQRDAALALLLAATRAEHPAHAEVAAGIEAAADGATRTSPGRGERGLAAVRALVDRARDRPLRAGDVAAIAGLGASVRPTDLDLLAQHALARGLASGFAHPAALEAARALAAAAPASRAAQALHGACALASGEVERRAPAVEWLAAAQLPGRPELLARTARAADAVAAALRARQDPTVPCDALRRALTELATDADLLPAQAVLLDPLVPAMRVALHDGSLIDRIDPRPRLALCEALAPVRDRLPPIVVALIESLRDTEDDERFQPSTPPATDRVAAGARALLALDPILGCAALELSVRHALEREAPAPDEATCLRLQVRADLVIERLDRAALGTIADIDVLWVMRTRHRAHAVSGQLHERRASLAADPEDRARLLEHALSHARRALDISHQATGLAARRLPVDAVVIARLLLRLGRPDELLGDALQADLPEPDAWRAEALRRRGDPEAARDHARACLADLAGGRERREASLLAALALAEIDLRELDPAREHLTYLRDVAEGRDGVSAQDVFSAAVVEAHLARAGGR